MIKVTLEFPNVELAIATLGKIMNAGAPKAAKGGPGQETPPAAAAAPAPTRRPGRPRKNATPAQPVSADKPPAGSTSVVEPAVAPQPAASAPVDNPAPDPSPAAAATLEEARKAIADCVGAPKCGLSVAQNILTGFGVRRVQDLAPERFGELVAAVKQRMAQ